MSWGAKKESPPRPAQSLRCPAPPRGAGQGGDFARGPGKFRALRAPVPTLNGGNLRIPQISCRRTGNNPSNCRTVILSFGWSRILATNLSGWASAHHSNCTFRPCCTPVFLALPIYFGYSCSASLSESPASSCGSGEFCIMPTGSGDTTTIISSSSGV